VGRELELRVSAVRAALEGVGGVEERPSQFAELPAWWVDGREFAHLGADGWLDLRLTKTGIRERRQWLRADPRSRLRRSGSDWVEVDISGLMDGDVAALLRAAAEASRPVALDRAPDPGRVVARARKLHQRGLTPPRSRTP